MPRGIHITSILYFNKECGANVTRKRTFILQMKTSSITMLGIIRILTVDTFSSTKMIKLET